METKTLSSFSKNSPHCEKTAYDSIYKKLLNLNESFASLKISYTKIPTDMWCRVKKKAKFYFSKLSREEKKTSNESNFCLYLSCRNVAAK